MRNSSWPIVTWSRARNDVDAITHGRRARDPAGSGPARPFWPLGRSSADSNCQVLARKHGTAIYFHSAVAVWCCRRFAWWWCEWHSWEVNPLYVRQRERKKNVRTAAARFRKPTVWSQVKIFEVTIGLLTLLVALSSRLFSTSTSLAVRSSLLSLEKKRTFLFSVNRKIDLISNYFCTLHLKSSTP